MNIIETSLKDVFEITPKVFGDDRGYFFESFNQKIFEDKIGYAVNFIQDNQSKSSYGVLRGLHFQKEPYAQAKLVRVIKGEVLDVAVDVRKGSPNFGKYVAVRLSEENKKQLFIPRGFAHGFLVLSERAEFVYKCDNFYAPEFDSGVSFNDSEVNIDWIINEKDIILSNKDEGLPSLENSDNNFIYSSISSSK